MSRRRAQPVRHTDASAHWADLVAELNGERHTVYSQPKVWLDDVKTSKAMTETTTTKAKTKTKRSGKPRPPKTEREREPVEVKRPTMTYCELGLPGCAVVVEVIDHSGDRERPACRRCAETAARYRGRGVPAEADTWGTT
jgi:hypothetical protein